MQKIYIGYCCWVVRQDLRLWSSPFSIKRSLRGHAEYLYRILLIGSEAGFEPMVFAVLDKEEPEGSY